MVIDKIFIGKKKEDNYAPIISFWELASESLRVIVTKYFVSKCVLYIS